MHHHHFIIQFQLSFYDILDIYNKINIFFLNSSLTIILTSLIKNMSFCSKCSKINKGRMIDRFKVNLVKLLLITALQFRSIFMPWAMIIDKSRLHNTIISNFWTEGKSSFSNECWKKCSFFLLLWSVTSREKN